MNNRVFISSTCFDLIDLRAELKVFLENLGFSPIMSDTLDSEFQTFHDKNSIETCLLNLDSCGHVIIILSQRYGAKLGKAGFEDISATHLEYKRAKEKKIPILFFVRDRLMADYDAYRKSKEPKSISWVNSDKDLEIFKIIEDRKTANNEDDNWRWIFRDSLEIKQRLIQDLKPSIDNLRMDRLIEKGNIPFITIQKDQEFWLEGNTKIELRLRFTNHGNQSAINPKIYIFDS
ncbi:MAG TPA: DUF4062 domain-containing protein, partial [Bacteroidia bacterium]|nr:DUF4062 domain-containing protein [Bacteroidia bacterium]